MKIYSPAIETYRAAGKAFIPVHLFRFTVKNRDTGAPVMFNFCSRDENEDFEVRAPNTGSNVTRTYQGGGHIVAVDTLVRSEGTVIRTFNATLSGASPEVLDMIQGHDCRDAEIEYHLAELDEDTMAQIAAARAEFVGYVDTIEHEDAALDVESSEAADSAFMVSMVSLGAALQRTNPAMRSVEESRTRSDDEIFKYADAAHQWVVPWGKESKSERDRRGGKDDNPTGGGTPDGTVIPGGGSWGGRGRT